MTRHCELAQGNERKCEAIERSETRNDVMN